MDIALLQRQSPLWRICLSHITQNCPLEQITHVKKYHSRKTACESKNRIFFEKYPDEYCRRNKAYYACEFSLCLVVVLPENYGPENKTKYFLKQVCDYHDLPSLFWDILNFKLLEKHGIVTSLFYSVDFFQKLFSGKFPVEVLGFF